MGEIPDRPLTFEEHIALLNGESLDSYRLKAAKREKLNAESDHYPRLHPDQWPQLIFNWDPSLNGQRFSLDGVSTQDFFKSYPQGFRQGWVKLAELDLKLCAFSRRDGVQELWEVGSSSRLAYLIAYLAHGLPISPPFVEPLVSNELILRGGHHRYAAAKATGLEAISSVRSMKPSPDGDPVSMRVCGRFSLVPI